MEEIDKQVQNLELIVALRVLQENDTPENRSRMIQEMLKSKFITPATIDEEEEKKAREYRQKGLKGSLQVKLATVHTKDGKHFLPAFTDSMQLNEWKERIHLAGEPKKMVMNFDAYAQYVLKSNGALNGFVINPYAENLVFTEETIRSILQQRAGHMARQAQKNVGGMINAGRPRDIFGKPPVAPVNMAGKEETVADAGTDKDISDKQ